MSPVPLSVSAEEGTGNGALSDETIVERVLQGDIALFEVLMRRTNQRLYRVLRGILKEEAEIEDVMQEAYIAAYSCLHQFAGRAKPTTWIIRIAIHNAYARLHKLRVRKEIGGAQGSEYRDLRDPEQLASTKEHVLLLQSAVDRLPDAYRVVFVMREIEQLDTADTADLLELSEELVRVRLHRAKAMLRENLGPNVRKEMFPFLGRDCDRIVFAVLSRIMGGAAAAAHV